MKYSRMREREWKRAEWVLGVFQTAGRTISQRGKLPKKFATDWRRGNSVPTIACENMNWGLEDYFISGIFNFTEIMFNSAEAKHILMVAKRRCEKNTRSKYMNKDSEILGTCNGVRLLANVEELVGRDEIDRVPVITGRAVLIQTVNQCFLSMETVSLNQ